MNTHYFVNSVEFLGIILFFVFVVILSFRLLKNARNFRKPDSSIVLITQNCENNIEGFLRCLDYFLMTAECLNDSEVIIIDNISNDHTASIIGKLTKQYKYLKFLKMSRPIDEKNILDELVKDLCSGRNVYAFSLTSKDNYSFCGEIIEIIRKKKENSRLLNNYI